MVTIINNNMVANKTSASDIIIIIHLICSLWFELIDTVFDVSAI